MDKWTGVDLDGTLAHYSGWKGINHIGKPIPKMVNRVKALIADGKTVKIFTARVAEGELAKGPIRKWLKENGLPDLEITNVKDFGMEELYDDRAIQVKPNTGEIVGE